MPNENKEVKIMCWGMGRGEGSDGTEEYQQKRNKEDF